MSKTLKVGDIVIFKLHNICYFQEYREGKILEIKRKNIFNEKMYRVTHPALIFPKAGMWMHRDEILEVVE